MKVLAVASAIAAVSANDLLSIWESAASASAEMVDAPIPMDRKVMDLFTLTNIFNYGCWCYFGDYSPVRGTAMDSVDGYCKQWYENKDCVVIDDATCDPDIDYEDVLGDLSFPFNPAHDYIAMCDAANAADACASLNCAIDATFLRDIFNHMAFNQLNQTLSQAMGFETAICHNAQAAAATTTGNPLTTSAASGSTAVPTTSAFPNMMCCGDYPARFPYRPRNGERRCCGTVTYQFSTLECCDASTSATAMIGSC